MTLKLPTFLFLRSLYVSNLYRGIYKWDGWGGVLKLVSDRFRMWIIDLNRLNDKEPLYLKHFLVVASDLPKTAMSKKEVTARSACGHIATCIIDEYGIKPSRMLFVENFPKAQYGKHPPKKIPAVLDAVEFEWRDRLALNPKRRPLESPPCKRV